MITEPLRFLAVPLASLNLDPANARLHGEKNLETLKTSLAQFGQRKPVVVQKDGMIVRAGNGTVRAARALGWTEIAAVIVDDDNATATQYAIADNRTAELAESDDAALASLLHGMDEQTRPAQSSCGAPASSVPAATGIGVGPAYHDFEALCCCASYYVRIEIGYRFLCNETKEHF